TVPVAPSKRAEDAFVGLQFEYEDRAVRLAENVASLNSSLGFTEFHDYPDPGWSIESNQASAIDRLYGIFSPNNSGQPIHVVVGEAGAAYCKFQTEQAQADAYVAMLSTASAHARGFFNWGLWDAAPGTCGAGDGSRFGMGFSPDEPRGVLGRLVDIG